MSQPDTELAEIVRKREAAQALAELLARAEAEGVEPFNFDEAFGEGAEEGQSQEEIRREVDEFLAMLQEMREVPSNRSIE